MNSSKKLKVKMFNSGSIDENTQRLGVLYQKHHKLMMGTACNITKDEDMAEDLVQDLYVYLGEKTRQKLWYKDSFNLLYCINFLQTRWINRVKRNNKFSYKESIKDDTSDTEYDLEFDNKLEEAYNKVLAEIYELKKTKMFASSMLYEMYWINNPDQTLKELSNSIGISNSTAFIHIKKVKEHLKKNIENPFKDEQ